MKNLILSIIICLFINSLFAQSVPQGMKYQAVARDLKGELIANQQVSLKIQLQGNGQLSEIYYSENHVTTTNQFGLFSLIIGEGIIEQGDFSEIPWNTQDIWIKIAIKLNGEASYTTISNGKLLTVPYAFHAGTANALTTKKSSDLFTKGEVGVTSQNWSLFGNSKSDPLKDKLGTSDAADLVFVTDNIERLRITADGQIITGPGKFTMGGNLEVDGATLINNSLTVTGTTSLGYLAVSNLNVKSDNANFVTEFENTNNGDGDGIKIKLGKKATKNSEGFKTVDATLKGFYLKDFAQDEFSSIKNLFDGSINSADGQFLSKMLEPNPEDALAIAASICILSEQVSGLIFKELNNRLKNVKFPTIKLPAMCVTVDYEVDKTHVCVPGLSEETTLVEGFYPIPNLPEKLNYSCDVIGTGFEFPILDFNDQSNVLDGENTFIEFTDNTNWKMGAIKAQSISEWATQYFDPVFLYGLYSTFKGLDKSKIFPEIKTKAKEVAKSYLAIGVQYSSGNGDYAEWLERMDPNESIGVGDIVAVKAGKITKDLNNAEQVMAVSHRPIVLGNIPKDGKNHLGNNIAFMGQIPVKIMGPVKTGDYVVGKGDIVGYGIAISPENMNIEDFKLAIGRSWETNLDSGPKMINTVVGVHNGDYINILKRYEQKFRESEARLESVEAKVDALTGIITANNKIN